MLIVLRGQLFDCKKAEVAMSKRELLSGRGWKCKSVPLRVHHTVTRDEFRIDRGNRRSVSPLVFKISSHSVSSDSNINSNKYFFVRRFINLQNRKKRKALEFVSIRGIIPFRSHDFNTSIYLRKYLNIFHPFLPCASFSIILTITRIENPYIMVLQISIAISTLLKRAHFQRSKR